MTTALATQSDMTSEILVKPANIQEQLLGKICGMRHKNLAAGQIFDIKNLSRRVGVTFSRLVKQYFGIDKEQILELSDQELEALFIVVCKRASRTALYLKVFFAVPVVGWVYCLFEFSDSSSNTLTFTRAIRKLKKIIGSNFNSVEILHKELS